MYIKYWLVTKKPVPVFDKQGHLAVTVPKNVPIIDGDEYFICSFEDLLNHISKHQELSYDYMNVSMEMSDILYNLSLEYTDSYAEGKLYYKNFGFSNLKNFKFYFTLRRGKRK